jgi:hypothetical protein
VRLIKTFGLAVISALAAMAFVGASSASATFDTAICLEPSPTLACPANKQAEHFHFLDPSAKLLTNVLNVTCHALFLGDALVPLAEAPESLEIYGTFTYTGCNNSCTAKEVANPELGGHILVLKTAADLAIIEGDEFEVRVVCAGLIECSYTGNGLQGHALSSNLPSNAGLVTSHEESVAHLPQGLLDICPSTGKLDALFEPLVDLWIRS